MESKRERKSNSYKLKSKSKRLIRVVSLPLPFRIRIHLIHYLHSSHQMISHSLQTSFVTRLDSPRTRTRRVRALIPSAYCYFRSFARLLPCIMFNKPSCDRDKSKQWDCLKWFIWNGIDMCRLNGIGIVLGRLMDRSEVKHVSSLKMRLSWGCNESDEEFRLLFSAHFIISSSIAIGWERLTRIPRTTILLLSIHLIRIYSNERWLCIRHSIVNNVYVLDFDIYASYGLRCVIQNVCLVGQLKGQLCFWRTSAPG